MYDSRAKEMLVRLLEQHEEDISASWAKLVYTIPDSHYQGLSLEELRASTQRGLQAIIEALASGSYTALENYLTDVSLTRLGMGFDVGEVIQALLCFKDAALPLLRRAQDLPEDALWDSVTRLSDCSRWMAGRFGDLYAAEMSRRLRREQQQAEHTLEIFFDRMPMGIAVFNSDLRLRRCNPTWAEYIDRYTPSNADQVVPGVYFFDLAPGTEEQAMPIFERVLAGEQVRQEALRLESGGIASYWDVVFTPLIEDGRVTGFVDVATDVTEREKMLEALRESEMHLRSLLENATNFVVYRIAVDEANPYGGRVLLVSPSIKEIIGIANPYRFEDWFENLHPDDLPRAMEANQRAIQHGQPYRQEVRVYHPGKQDWIWVHTASTPVFDAEGNLTHFNGLILDITEQKRAEQAVQEAYQTLEARIEARTRELQTILAVTAAASSSLELDEMLRAALDRLVALVGASRAGVMLLSHESGGLEPRMLRPDYPMSPDDLAEITPACRSVMESGQPLYIPVDEAGGFFEPGALLPLRVRGQAIGVLVIVGPRGGEFSQEHQALFESIADQLGVAIENARLYEEAERSAVIAERNRLARDLHDAVTQTLFSASIIAEVLPRLWERDPEEGRRRLEELRQLTRGALAEMRTLLLELRPTALAEAEIGELFRHLSEAFTGRTRVPVELEVSGDCPLPAEVKVALYRIAQEALNNVAKHAAARQAWLSLDCQPDQTRLVIRDDGRGFDPRRAPAESLGLGIMRERAEAIGARLTIESQPGQGTCIMVEWLPGQSVA